MSILLTVNGTTYSYPEQGDTNWGADATDWASAVTTGMLQKAGGIFQILSELDFGTAFGIKSLYYKSRTANVASTGQIRLARADTIVFRNQANDGDLALSVDASNVLLFNGVSLAGVATVSDTNSINMTLTGNDLAADLNLSASPADAGFINAVLTIETDGLQGQVPIADTSTTGVLTNTDWNTFNAKQPAGSYITALTGDVTASGPGSVAATIGANKVTDAMIRQSAALSVIGNATNALANVADISAGSDNFVLRRSGTALGFALILNANIDPSAAIAYSKLSLSNSIVNADINASAAIDFSKLAALASANILVGSVGNVATSVAMTGDISITNAGVTAIGAGVIVNADINASAAIAYSKLSLSNSIVNADINASAAIAYSKLSLSNSILNADINASAAIAYSKLNLTGSILNADINASAAIAASKLAALTASKAVVTDGSGFISAASTSATEIGYVAGVTSAIQTQLDAKQLRSVLTTKGDLYAATASNTVTRLGVGTDGYVLTADSAQATGMKWSLSAGGGGGVIDFQPRNDQIAPQELFVNFLQFWSFAYQDQMALYAQIKIPNSYSAGSQIKLINGGFKVNSTDTTKKVLFQTNAYLIKTGTDLSVLGTPYVSTNAQVAVGATANICIAIGDIDLTSASGQINAVSVAAGDLILVRLTRAINSESPSLQDVADLIAQDFQLTLS